MSVERTSSAAAVAVIDLGILRDGPELPGRSPASRPLRRRAASLLGVALVVLATAVTASPVRAALVERTFPSVPAMSDQPVVVDTTDGLYLVRPSRPEAGPGERTITRYGTARPDEVWRVPVTTPGAVNSADVVDGVLLVHAEGWQPETIALRAADGRELWRRTGWWQEAGSGQLLLSYRAPDGRGDIYEAVALTTGAVRWSLSLSASGWVLRDRDRLVWWSVDGRVEVRDLRTGAVVSRGVLPREEHATAPQSQPGIQVAGGLLLVAGWDGDRPVVSAYGLDRLDPRWRAGIDLSIETVHGCGTALCVSRTNGRGGVRIVEPHTGRTRWADGRWDYLLYAGPTLLAFGPPHGPSRIAAIDPATGRQLGDLGRWQTPPALDPEGRILAVRTEPGTSRSWIAELDPAARTTRVLGVADDAYACRAGHTAVTCRRTGGTVGVWYPQRSK